MVVLLIFSLVTNIIGVLCFRSVLKSSNLLVREYVTRDAHAQRISVSWPTYFENSLLYTLATSVLEY